MTIQLNYRIYHNILKKHPIISFTHSSSPSRIACPWRFPNFSEVVHAPTCDPTARLPREARQCSTNESVARPCVSLGDPFKSFLLVIPRIVSGLMHLSYKWTKPTLSYLWLLLSTIIYLCINSQHAISHAFAKQTLLWHNSMLPGSKTPAFISSNPVMAHYILQTMQIEGIGPVFGQLARRTKSSSIFQHISRKNAKKKHHHFPTFTTDSLAMANVPTADCIMARRISPVPTGQEFFGSY